MAGAVSSDIDKAREAMAARIKNGPPFTFAQLWAHGNEAAGWREDGSQSPAYRLADRMIQWHRKRRQLRMERVGRSCIWHPVIADDVRAAPDLPRKQA